MTVSSQVIEVLNYLCGKFGIVIDWSAENVMPYVQELMSKFIQWEIATSRMWIVFAVLSLLVCVALIVTDAKTSFTDGFGVAIGICFAITLVAIIGFQVYDIITCTHFPEMKILEYLRAQMNVR